MKFAPVLLLFSVSLAGCGSAYVNSTTPPTDPNPPSSGPPTEGVVSINFDDGYESAYEIGLPIVEQAGFKTTQFIITKLVGTPGYVTTGQILAMQNSGHEIGDHTRTHPDLSTLTPAQQKDEIVGAQQDLINLGVTPTSFAFPFGAHDDSTQSILAAAGFTAARTTNKGVNDENSDPLLLNCWVISPAGVTTDINQITQAIDDAQANGKWLILLFHRIDETGNPISVPHTLLQGTVDHLVEKKTKVITLKQGPALYHLK
jgi:peptidoglycan/xylan/chitin deacetylase (PgdA/CDA1 family)